MDFTGIKKLANEKNKMEKKKKRNCNKTLERVSFYMYTYLKEAKKKK